jgi:hypothetical protein
MGQLLRLGLMACCALSVVPTAPHIARAADWLDGNWSNRIELRAKPELIAGVGTFTDITLLLTLSSDSLSTVFDRAKGDGSDLLFTAGDGTSLLDHEIVSYDPVGRAAEIWFRAAALSTTANVFYMYYGNPDTTVSVAPGGAWPADHLAVYHFEQDPSFGFLPDSGPASNFAQVGPGSSWTSSDRVIGQVGRAWRFDNLTDWLYCNSISSPDSSFTISAWYSNVASSQGGTSAFESSTGGWGVAWRRTVGSPHATLETSRGYYTWMPAIADTLFHQYVWTLDAAADTAHFFLDGIEQQVHGYYAPNPPYHVYVGESIQGRVGIAGPAFYNSLNLSDGVVDEYRIVEGVRDADRILTEYRNGADPKAFFTYRVQENGTSTAVGPPGDGGRPAVGRITIWPNPSRGWAELGVEMDSPTIRVAVYDVAGRLVRVLRPASRADRLLRLQWDGRDERGTTVGNGTYYVRATGDRASLQTKVLLMR